MDDNLKSLEQILRDVQDLILSRDTFLSLRQDNWKERFSINDYDNRTELLREHSLYLEEAIVWLKQFINC